MRQYTGQRQPLAASITGAPATSIFVAINILFFAGVIFATSLKQAESLPRVFSSNLLGAILGGLCEYASMAVGFRNLYLIGLGLYALSFLTMPRARAVHKDAQAAATRPASVTAGDSL